MNVKTLLLAGACAIGFGSAAFATDQSVIDTITANLAAQGYTSMHVVNGPDGVRVEATGPNGTIEQVYDAQGNLVREETGTGNDNGFNGDDDGLDDGLDDGNDDGNDDDMNDGDSSDDDSNDDDSNDDDSSDDDSSDSNDDDSNDSNDDNGDDD